VETLKVKVNGENLTDWEAGKPERRKGRKGVEK